jgi:Protein of unknown function (DUF3168)
VSVVADAIYTRLNGDAVLVSLGVTGVFRNLAPQRQSLPYIVIQLATGTDQHALGSTQAYEEQIWQVKGISHGPNPHVADNVADRIYTLLNHYALPISGKNTMVCRRDTSFAYPEVDSGEMYHHAGGRYRIGVS